MSKKYDTMNAIAIGFENATVDKESVKAQKQWEKDGTVTVKYLESTLGDISKGILAVAPYVEEKDSGRKPSAS